MTKQLILICALALIVCGMTAHAIEPEAYAAAKAAQAYRAKGEPVEPAADGTFFCEAEEFQVANPANTKGWQAKPWGENYYAATFANTFLSRKAFLGAPEQCDETTAGINVDIKQAGRYLVLARYEAAYRFETQFTIKIEQNGKVVFNKLYGARDNLKIWAFNSRVTKEVAWSWGAVENVVWEGYIGDGKNTYAELQPGLAKITLIAGKQPEDAAKRNVDLVMLTTDEAQVKTRVTTEGYLPLDGWLTQTGDVWVRATNAGDKPVTVTAGMTEHSSYWIHQRNWKPFSVTADAGKTSDWADVGGVMDSLNDGQWTFNASGPCTVEIGVKNAAGQIQPVRTLDMNGTLGLIGLADMRYSRKVQTQREGVNEMTAYLKVIPMQGRMPTQTMIIAASGIIDDLTPIYGLNGSNLKGPKGYEDWRGLSPQQLEEKCQKLTEAQRANIAVMSLGDEIGLPTPSGAAANEGFVAFLKAQGLTPGQVDPAAGNDWTKITFKTDAPKDTKPGLFYWSMRYHQTYGVQSMKALTDVLRKYLPNVQVGANYSPHGGARHAFLGDVNQWVDVFREDAMTMPWSEDYIWQLPVGTPQMNSIDLDLFRAGVRGKPNDKIHMYVMPHMPGNTPDMWKRLWYSSMGHGAKIFNLFEFDPVWAAYTENHVTGNSMYGEVLKTIREYGTFEDIVQTGQKRPSQVGLWFSDTADIWDDYGNSGGAAKRAMYIAILNQQLPLDFVVEQDAQDGTLNQYKVLYLTDQHVSEAASKAIAAWVQKGGRLFATAGAGMFDEYNRPNTVLRQLMGITDVTMMLATKENQVDFVKQDLPFVQPVDEVTVTKAAAGFPVFAVASKVTVAKDVQVGGTFKDGSPAIFSRKAGQGQITCCGFMPGLSFFKPAIPRKPLDRGATADAMAHFLPVNFDGKVGAVIGDFAPQDVRPVLVSQPCVEATILEAKSGTAITLANWTNTPVKGLQVTMNIPVPTKQVTLSTGKPVKMEKVNGKTVFTLDLEVADTIILR